MVPDPWMGHYRYRPRRSSHQTPPHPFTTPQVFWMLSPPTDPYAHGEFFYMYVQSSSKDAQRAILMFLYSKAGRSSSLRKKAKQMVQYCSFKSCRRLVREESPHLPPLDSTSLVGKWSTYVANLIAQHTIPPCTLRKTVTQI